MTPKMVYVEWIDSVRNESIWLTEEEAKQWGRAEFDRIKELGFLIYEEDDFIVLAQRVNPQYDEDGKIIEVRADGLMKIPKSQLRILDYVTVSSSSPVR